MPTVGGDNWLCAHTGEVPHNQGRQRQNSITDGKAAVEAEARLIRARIVVIYDGQTVSLKRFKDAKARSSGFGGGIISSGYNDIKTGGDVIDATMKEEVRNARNRYRHYYGIGDLVVWTFSSAPTIIIRSLRRHV